MFHHSVVLSSYIFFLYSWLCARSPGSPVYAPHFQCGLCQVPNVSVSMSTVGIIIEVTEKKKGLDDTTGQIKRIDVFLGCVGTVRKHPLNHPGAFSFDQKETLFWSDATSIIPNKRFRLWTRTKRSSGPESSAVCLTVVDMWLTLLMLQ